MQETNISALMTHAYKTTQQQQGIKLTVKTFNYFEWYWDKNIPPFQLCELTLRVPVTR